MQTFYKLFLFFLICCNVLCYAQGSKFAPLPVVLFEDDFKGDSLGSFPGKWWIGHVDSTRLRPYYSVRDIQGKRALAERSTSNANNSGYLGSIAPRMGDVDYLPRRFTVEYDLLMNKNGGASLECIAFGAEQFVSLGIVGTNGRISAQNHVGERIPVKHDDWYAVLPGFDLNKWHHIAVFYADLQAAYYVDGRRIFVTMPHTGNLRKLLLSYDRAGSDELDSVAYANFRLCADSNREAAKFSRLLADSTFVSHAIVFEVDKTDIKGESIVVIAQLALWLKAHPAVKLQIAGHTDNDGKPAANMTLSQKRADVVKGLLVSYGVTADRLTTKGYGDTRPVQPNTTPEGKAENRRVEFVRR